MNKVPKRKWNQLISAHEEKKGWATKLLIKWFKKLACFWWIILRDFPCYFLRRSKQADSIVMRSRDDDDGCLVLLQQSITVLRVVLPHPFSCVGTKDWWMPEWLLTPLKNTCCQLLATQLNFLVLTVANNSKGAKLSSIIECFHFPPEFKHDQENRLLRKQQVY